MESGGKKPPRPLGRVKSLKGASCSHWKLCEAVAQLWELPLQREEVEPTNWAPKHRASMPASADHEASSGERPWGLSLLGREETRWRKSHYLFFSFSSLILKGAKAQVWCSQPLTLGPREGRVAQTGVAWGVWSGIHRRDMGEQPLAFMCWDIPGFCSSSLSWEEQAPPRGKAVILPCGISIPLPSGILVAPPCIFVFLFLLLFSPVFHLVFSVFFLLSFLP